MNSTLLSVFALALMAVGSACGSNSVGSAEAGGAPESGNAAGGRSGSSNTIAWGSTSSSGSIGSSGGDASTGGVAGAGGARASSGTAIGSGIQGGSVAQGGSTAQGGSAAQGGEGIRTRKIQTRGYTFDALELPSTGEPVLLLHGFPDTSLEWSVLMPVLAANGYHCLAPDQRGYSPGARPTEVAAYRYEELVADAFAIASELGDRFHVIGHDWGANVGWLMLEKDPSRIASFTAISIPHYQVWARSVYEDQAMAGYLSMLDTWMTEGKGEAYWTAEQMNRMWTAKSAVQRSKTVAHMLEPGAMTAALNWYRASRGHKRVFEEFDVWTVSVPTLLLHGSRDLGERALKDTAPLMTGAYRLVRPTGGHFIVDEQPDVVAVETLAHLRANPIE
ncbi:MAG: alpha/beta hydrolase [Polyangiaceae bacterium]